MPARRLVPHPGRRGEGHCHGGSGQRVGMVASDGGTISVHSSVASVMRSAARPKPAPCTLPICDVRPSFARDPARSARRTGQSRRGREGRSVCVDRSAGGQWAIVGSTWPRSDNRSHDLPASACKLLHTKALLGTFSKILTTSSSIHLASFSM
jgi:hypothetical protein